MEKRGLEAKTLVWIIIVIICFAIILLVIKTWPFTQTIDKEACHESVLLRSLPGISEASKLITPLRCKTEDIRIDKNYRTEQMIQERVANAMYDCWWMLGEGKLTPFSESTWKEMGVIPAKSLCVICSTIKFDNKIKEKISQVDVLNYLNKEKIPGKDTTYFEYFSDEKGTILPTDVKVEPIKTDNDYAIIFSGFESEALWGPIAKDAGIVAGSFMMLGGSMTGKLAKGLFGISRVTIPAKLNYMGTIPSTTVLKGLGLYALPALIAFLGYQFGVAVWGQHVAAGYCDGEREGCFQILLVPYDADRLKKACGTIESIP